MLKLNTILFPVDFSPRCVDAVPSLKSWVAQFSSRLTLIHAVDVPSAFRFGSSERLGAQLRKALIEESSYSMDDFVESHFKSVPSQHFVEEGDAADLIVDHARAHKTALIMMPTRGYGPFRRFLTGSVTSKVLHDAPCPVWTAAHTTRAPSGKPHAALCAIDLGEDTVTLMRWAHELASQWGANLRFVYVNPAINETSKNRGEKAVRKYLSGEAQETFARLTKKAGLSLPLLIRGGDIAHQLAATVRSQEADLLIVGRGRLRKRLGGMRAHSLAIVCESPCPVISY
jgi:nucleotide-binding universal stress UspA family protein